MQAKNLTGNMELYEEFGSNSGWLGGSGESWERGHYYVRGLVALAYALNDNGLIKRAAKWIDYAVDNQKDNGDFGSSEILRKEISFESRKGTSAHGNAPFFIADPCSENGEKVLFGVLEYSGNFKISVNRDGFGVTRAMLGVNDFDFSISLKSGEGFSAPWVYFGCTESVNEVSRIMNRFALNHILPEQFREKPLPVLYNSWEATDLM